MKKFESTFSRYITKQPSVRVKGFLIMDIILLLSIVSLLSLVVVASVQNPFLQNTVTLDKKSCCHIAETAIYEDHNQMNRYSLIASSEASVSNFNLSENIDR